MQQAPSDAPRWTKQLLIAAALYNLVWGSTVVLAPLALFRWAGLEPPRYPEIWQCVGMIVGVYGIGYWLASHDPFRHWPIVLVGLLGKVFGPIGFLQAASTGALPWKWGATIVTNDLIWWVPFTAILYLAFRKNTDTSASVPTDVVERAIGEIRGSRNSTMHEVSQEAPTIVAFLRHSGCTFCRETLFELARAVKDHRGSRPNIAIVHMGQPMDGTQMVERFGLRDVHMFADPKCTLYRAFGLERGRLSQLCSWYVIRKGLRAVLNGYGLGKLNGDGFRMPGAFLLFRGDVIRKDRPATAADQPDFKALVSAAGALTPTTTTPRVAASSGLAPAP